MPSSGPDAATRSSPLRIPAYSASMSHTRLPPSATFATSVCRHPADDDSARYTLVDACVARSAPAPGCTSTSSDTVSPSTRPPPNVAEYTHAYDPWFFEGLATHYEAALQPGVGRPRWPIFTGMFAAGYAGETINGGDLNSLDRLASVGYSEPAGDLIPVADRNKAFSAGGADDDALPPIEPPA